VLTLRLLGVAAGGGFPQWNCSCAPCRRARAGDPAVKPRTQASLAVSGDSAHWFLINASPDLRQQIGQTPVLHPDPARGVRHSPISGVVLSSAEIDHTAGLLSLRERQPLTIYLTQRVRAALAANPMFSALAADVIRWREVDLDEEFTLNEVGGAAPGVTARLFAVPGKVPLYMEAEVAADGLAGCPGDTVGVELCDPRSGRRVCYIPGCAAISAAVRQRLEGVDLLFFDGTVWTDDELQRAGVGTKTGARMGHLAMSGADGSIARLASLRIGRRVFVHINNTNPVLIDGSAERRAAEEAGWLVPEDGAEFVA